MSWIIYNNDTFLLNRQLEKEVSNMRNFMLKATADIIIPLLKEDIVSVVGNDDISWVFIQIFSLVDQERKNEIIETILSRMGRIINQPQGKAFIASFLKECSHDDMNQILNYQLTNFEKISRNHSSFQFYKMAMNFITTEQLERLELNIISLPNFSSFIYSFFGSQVIQNLVFKKKSRNYFKLKERILKETLQLSYHEYGNYLIQKIIRISTEPDLITITGCLLGSIVGLSINDYGKNVIASLLKTKNPQVHRMIVFRIKRMGENDKEVLFNKGSFVVQAIEKYCSSSLKKKLFSETNSTNQVTNIN